jgi:hypothetical protein
MLYVIAIWTLVIGLLGAKFLAKAYAPVSTGDVAGLHVLSGVRGGSARVDQLFAAYLSRARRYRTSWSVVGWISGLVLAFGFALESGAAASADPVALMVLMGFSGYLLGAIVAELHHLRRSRHGARTASLTPRSLRDYMGARQRWFLRCLALLALALGVVGIGVQATTSDTYEQVPGGPRILVQQAETFWISLVVLAVVATTVWVVIELAQRAIVERPRPALPDDLAEADDAIRRASLSTVALGGSGLVALIACVESGTVARNTAGAGSMLCTIAVFVLFGLAIQLMFRTRRVAWPERKLEKDGGIW